MAVMAGETWREPWLPRPALGLRAAAGRGDGGGGAWGVAGAPGSSTRIPDLSGRLGGGVRAAPSAAGASSGAATPQGVAVGEAGGAAPRW